MATVALDAWTCCIHATYMKSPERDLLDTRSSQAYAMV
jgi:hypothetical protein